MTTRSSRSDRSSKARLTDGDVYVYLLQLGVLSWITRPKPVVAHDVRPPGPVQTPSSSSTASPSKKNSDGASSASSGAAWMTLGGLADMVKEVGGSSKTARFPEKLIKRLNDRLEQIAMGRDPHYRDQSLRQTIGAFYGTFKEPSFQKQMKENRRIEEMILIFVTTAQGSLKKRMEGDLWKEELNKQVAQFVKIIRECLKTMHGVSKELMDRLEGYSTKLAPSQPIALNGQPASPAESSAQPSMGSRRASAATSTTAVEGGNPLHDSSLIRTIGQLFQVNPDQLQKDVDFMRKSCTDQAAMIDLKRCVKNINLQAAWPARREDFDSDEAYQQWRSHELHALSQIMTQMCKDNPELLKTSNSESGGSAAKGRNGDASSVPAEVAAAAQAGTKAPDAEALSESIADDEEEALAGFTYIPPDPKTCYRRTLELCIDYDLEQIKYQPEDEEVSLSILSRPHVELLAECALRWRIMAPFRAIANLGVIRYKYDRGEVPLDCISEALATTQRILEDSSFEMWTRADQEFLVQEYSSLFESSLRFIHEAFQDIESVSPDDVQPYILMVEDLHASGLARVDGRLDAPVADLERCADEVKDRVRIMAIHAYTAKTTDLFSQHMENELVPLAQLLEWIEKRAKRIDKLYPQPVLGSVDPVSLILEKQVRLYLDDLESMKGQVVAHATREQDPLAFDDVFVLYDKVAALLRMHKAFCPDQELHFSISDWFEPFLRHWLANLEKKTSEWVQNAISSDRFVPIDSEGAVHSSSIDDLFGALQQPADFILSLQWPDPYRNARFLTSLAKTASRSIEQYCSRMEELFMEEMFPRTEGEDTRQKQSAWMVKAKQTLQGEKKVEPFHFQEKSCIKLNNIEAARVLLDKLYSRIEADEQARIIAEHAPGVPEKQQRQRFLFTIKVVLGENLRPIRDTSANARIDSFVTLSDEHGNKIAKTRTIYETPDPRWEEAFDISTETSMWLAATVWDRKLVGDHNLCGRAYLRLDPRYFGDFLAHDLWLDLDTQGRLLLRVSMEGERDDIRFYFGRAFRSLKRAESDMVRTIVDKMSITIRQCLSRSVLKSMVRTSGINLDKALGDVKALAKAALASTNVNGPSIPPVESEAPKKARPQQLTDHEIEQAIAPLLDYLDECLGTLKASLGDEEAQLVLTKVWKEVLNAIDAILLPPLSDSPSDMAQLSGREVEVVFKWLSMLRNYFNAYDEETGVAHGVPLEILQGPKYREIVSYTLHHDTSTDELMEACVREMQQRLRRAPSKRAKNKSVMQQRSLGTIKKRKEDKKKEEQDDNLDVILRLLRMRAGTSDFLQQQFATMGSLQIAMAGGGKAGGGRGVGAPIQSGARARRMSNQPVSPSHPPPPPQPPLPSGGMGMGAGVAAGGSGGRAALHNRLSRAVSGGAVPSVSASPASSTGASQHPPPLQGQQAPTLATHFAGGPRPMGPPPMGPPRY